MATAAVIPVHNRASLICNAIASVQCQTLSIDEIIVVDDASTDATADVVMGLARKDRRIRLRVLPTNVGASAARNVGIDSTKCDWISFLDSDDEWMVPKHEMQMDALLRNPSAIASFTGIRYRHLQRDDDVYAPVEITLHALRGMNRLGSTSTAIIRRESLKSVGGFDPTLPSCQDWDLWLRLRSAGDFAIVPSPLVILNQFEQVRISLNKIAVLCGHQQLFAKILNDVSDPDQRRVITASHQARLAQIYLWDLDEPTPALIAALKSFVLNPTPEGKAFVREALRTRLRACFYCNEM